MKPIQGFTFGYRSKNVFDAELINKHPGVGQYNVDESYSNIVSNKQQKFPLCQRFSSQPQITPGPGQYDCKTDFDNKLNKSNSSHFFQNTQLNQSKDEQSTNNLNNTQSSKQSYFQSVINDHPGPGHYSIQSSFNHLKPAMVFDKYSSRDAIYKITSHIPPVGLYNCDSTIKLDSSVLISPSKKVSVFDVPKATLNNPGPCKYDKKSFIDESKSGPHIPVDQRFKEQIQQAPGPGHYDHDSQKIQSQVSKSLKYSFQKAHKKDIFTISEDVPGPQFYNTQMNIDKKKINLTFGTGQRYDITKWQRGPGVGAYKLPSVFDKKPKPRKKPQYICPVILKKNLNQNQFQDNQISINKDNYDNQNNSQLIPPQTESDQQLNEQNVLFNENFNNQSNNNNNSNIMNNINTSNFSNTGQSGIESNTQLHQVRKSAILEQNKLNLNLNQKRFSLKSISQVRSCNQFDNNIKAFNIQCDSNNSSLLQKKQQQTKTFQKAERKNEFLDIFNIKINEDRSPGPAYYQSNLNKSENKSHKFFQSFNYTGFIQFTSTPGVGSYEVNSSSFNQKKKNDKLKMSQLAMNQQLALLKEEDVFQN